MLEIEQEPPEYPEQTVEDMVGAPDEDVPEIVLPDADPDEDDPEDVIA